MGVVCRWGLALLSHQRGPCKVANPGEMAFVFLDLVIRTPRGGDLVLLDVITIDAVRYRVLTGPCLMPISWLSVRHSNNMVHTL